MSTIKYLYGKKSILGPLVEGAGGIRLCDIRHYGRLENEKIRDLEERKQYEYEPGNIVLTVNGHEIKAEEFASNIKLDLPTRLCYCICFSNKKDAPEMYEKFNADICIEFDIDKLVEFLEFVFPSSQGCSIVHKPVTYYDTNPLLSQTDPESSAFMKPEAFKDEDEYRVAVFFPFDEKTEMNHGDKKVPMLKECQCSPEELESCQCYFVFFDNGLNSKFKSYIPHVHTKS